MIAVVVENVFDACLVAQEVPEVMVIALGSAQHDLDPRTRSRLASAEAVLFALDGDDAGRRAAWKWISKLHNAHRLPVPPKYGKDLGEAVCNGLPIKLFVEIGAERAGCKLPTPHLYAPSASLHDLSGAVRTVHTATGSFTPPDVAKPSQGAPVGIELVASHDAPYKLIVDAATAELVVAGLREMGQRIAVDIETQATSLRPRAALDPYQSKPRLLQAFVSGPAYLFDLNHVPLALLEPLIQGEWCAHNAVFDYKHLSHHGLHPSVPTCTMLLDNALRNRSVTLAQACRDHLGMSIDKELQTSDWGALKLSEQQLRYAAGDVYRLRDLWRKLRGKAYRSGRENLARVLLRAQPAVATMELHGLGIDTAAHGALIETWIGNRNAAFSLVLEVAGNDFNPRSSPQVEELLKRNLSPEELAHAPRTATGALSTRAEDLGAFRHILAVEHLLEFKRWEKLVSSFGQNLAGQVNPVSGRLHTHFMLSGAGKTGRMSSSNPSVHQMPRDEDFRRLFIPSKGNVLIRADYSQIQLRIAALLSGDARLMAAYENGEDVHRLTAASVLHKSPDLVTSQERSLAKAIGFGMLFGMGAPGLQRYAMASYGVRLDISEAERMITRFFETYPDLRRWRLDRVDEARSNGSVTTPLGRVRNFVAEEKDDVYTAAMNTPIQGGEAEVMLAALGELPEALAPYNAFPVNCIHDELLIECPAANAMSAIEAVRDAMARGMLHVFPTAPLNGLVEIAQGATWADAK